MRGKTVRTAPPPDSRFEIMIGLGEHGKTLIQQSTKSYTEHRCKQHPTHFLEIQYRSSVEHRQEGEQARTTPGRDWPVAFPQIISVPW